MKKMIALILVLVMSISLIACSNNSEVAPSEENQQEFTIEELKAITAVKAATDYFYDNLKDPESASILKLTVVAEPGEPQGYHMVKIEFNAANSMGGKERDELYIETNRGGLGDNSEYFSDNDAERILDQGDNARKYNECTNEGMEEIEVDVDTVMNHLDLTEDELYDLIWEKFDELGIE